MALNKVNIIGEQAWHVFVDENGNKVQEECTLDEYDALAEKEPINPTKKGFTWSHSYKDWQYNTPSGRLEDNCYAIEPTGRIVAKQTGKHQENKATLLELEEI